MKQIVPCSQHPNALERYNLGKRHVIGCKSCQTYYISKPSGSWQSLLKRWRDRVINHVMPIKEDNQHGIKSPAGQVMRVIN